MPREVFVAGQILTAAEMNIVSDQTVMVFAGTAARGSAIPTPSEGMAAYLSDSNILSLYDGADWKNSLGVTGGILQVVSTTKTDTFTTSSGTYVDITGLSATITPRSTSSKILVLYSVFLGQSSTSFANIRLDRNGTDIGIGDAAGSRDRVTLSSWTGGTNSYMTVPAGMFLDSPSSTASTTYTIQIRSTGSVTEYVNRSARDTDAATEPRGVSSITLIEVAG